MIHSFIYPLNNVKHAFLGLTRGIRDCPNVILIGAGETWRHIDLYFPPLEHGFVIERLG
jgi:hypothetical protein